MAIFIGTSVWLFEKKKKRHEVNLIFFFSDGYIKYYLIENKYFGF